MAFISIVIPLYNKEAIVEHCVRSVLEQSFTDFELIIVDDGSTDDSADVVRGICDKRIRFIQQENAGPSSARNKGVELANGKYVVLLDADDEMMSGALQAFYDCCIKNSDADMILGEVYVESNGRSTISMEYKEGYLRNAFKAEFHHVIMPCSGTLMYKRSILVANPFNEQIRRFEDLERLFRLFRFAKIYLMHVPVALVHCAYASASNARRDIKEDFVGHLDISGKSFWEKMAVYKVLFQEHAHYPMQARQLYPHFFRRYDLKLFTMLVMFIMRTTFLRRIWVKIMRIDINP